jgi:hypothetical protein
MCLIRRIRNNKTGEPGWKHTIQDKVNELPRAVRKLEHFGGCLKDLGNSPYKFIER